MNREQDTQLFAEQRRHVVNFELEPGAPANAISHAAAHNPPSERS